MIDYISYNQWVHQNDEKIKAEYSDKRTADLADEVERNYYTVSRKAKRLGVQKSEAFMRSSWAKDSKPLKTTKEEREQFRIAADAYLKEHFADTTNEVLARHFGVDVKTVRRWARRLGLQKTEAFMQRSRAKRGLYRFYTPEQEAYRLRRIAEVYPDGTEEELQALGSELGIGLDYIRQIARHHGIHRSEARMKENVKKSWESRKIFTPELVDEIAAYYPTHSNEECATHFDVNLGSLKLVASKNKWKKNKEYLHIVRSAARNTKK